MISNTEISFSRQDDLQLVRHKVGTFTNHLLGYGELIHDTALCTNDSGIRSMGVEVFRGAELVTNAVAFIKRESIVDLPRADLADYSDVALEQIKSLLSVQIPPDVSEEILEDMSRLRRSAELLACELSSLSKSGFRFRTHRSNEAT